jgi:hypothetical protein
MKSLKELSQDFVARITHICVLAYTYPRRYVYAFIEEKEYSKEEKTRC